MLPAWGDYSYFKTTNLQFNSLYQMNIKVYAFKQNSSTTQGVVIINKDTNSTLNGVVQICFNSNQNATYYYIEADQLL
jgi:hypothetical protein